MSLKILKKKWTLISFIKFNKQSIKNNGSTFLCKPFNLLVVKLRVNLRGSRNCLWSNLIAIWVDIQLKKNFGIQGLLRHRVQKTKQQKNIYILRNFKVIKLSTWMSSKTTICGVQLAWRDGNNLNLPYNQDSRFQLVLIECCKLVYKKTATNNKWL